MAVAGFKLNKRFGFLLSAVELRFAQPVIVVFCDRKICHFSQFTAIFFIIFHEKSYFSAFL